MSHFDRICIIYFVNTVNTRVYKSVCIETINKISNGARAGRFFHLFYCLDFLGKRNYFQLAASFSS